MSSFEKYFDNTYRQLEPNVIDIQSLLQEEMTLVVGDFYGIQKFIFERLSTKNASKVLRAKSAFVQIFTEYVTKYICHMFNIDEKYVLTQNAGKFEILVPQKDIDLTPVQNQIDNYFIKNFFALSGMILAKKECQKNDFIDSGSYRKLRESIATELETKKFQKFDLISTTPVLSYDNDIDNATLCKICNIRKIENEHCPVCHTFIELGKKLSQEHKHELISTKDLKIVFEDGFETKIKLTSKIKSYILFKKAEEENYSLPAEFDDLAKASCKDSEVGIKALGILKGDVDGMGKFLEESDVTQSFENFDLFSKTVDNFFSLYVPDIMKTKYPNTYTVFAGGDDLFLVGAWDEILALAKEIREEFKKFAKNKLSISFGIAIAKPTTPISYMAHHTEELLEDAKAIDEEKDAISLFGETVKWQSYNEVHHTLYPKLEELKQDELKTALLYRLLSFCDMSKNIDNDIKNTMWKSKLNYLFHRNMKKHEHLIGELDTVIEKNPKETKMVISEFIYKNRSAS